MPMPQPSLSPSPMCCILYTAPTPRVIAPGNTPCKSVFTIISRCPTNPRFPSYCRRFPTSWTLSRMHGFCRQQRLSLTRHHPPISSPRDTSLSLSLVYPFCPISKSHMNRFKAVISSCIYHLSTITTTTVGYAPPMPDLLLSSGRLRYEHTTHTHTHTHTHCFDFIGAIWWVHRVLESYWDGEEVKLIERLYICRWWWWWRLRLIVGNFITTKPKRWRWGWGEVLEAICWACSVLIWSESFHRHLVHIHLTHLNDDDIRYGIEWVLIKHRSVSLDVLRHFPLRISVTVIDIASVSYFTLYHDW